MKFLTKINRNYLFLFVLILLVVSTAGYFVLKMIILEDTKESLLEKEIHIAGQITETGDLPNIFPIVEVKIISGKTVEKPVFKIVYIEDELESELEPFLEYSNELKVGETWYRIQIRQSTFESEDLVLVLSLVLFILLLAAFGISYFITKKMNNTVWADFEKNLSEIESFSFRENKTLNLKKSDIEEFERLNKVINGLTTKLTGDYFSLKHFTENASHEIQTPLAVIMLNLEEVLQQNISEDAFKKVVTSINACKRLSSLNQSLVLLTKIENRQFKAGHTIFINKVVQQKLQEFETLFETKNIKVDFQNIQNFELTINEQLAEVLISNLLSNAINHNIRGGLIEIFVQQNEFKICNTGKANTLNNETIFDRFSKGDSKSYGLGLAIVKNICTTHHLDIQYLKETMHCFVIKNTKIDKIKTSKI